MRVPAFAFVTVATTVLLGSTVLAAEPAAEGVLIKTVVADSAAAKIGLQSGDRILSVDGAPVGDAFSMAVAISTHQAGKTLQLSVLRAEKIVNISGIIGRPRIVAATATTLQSRSNPAPIYLSDPKPVIRPIGE